MRLRVTLLASATLLSLSGAALASGGGGFDQSGFSSRGVDQQYEIGRSLYQARQADGTQLEYCVKKGDSLNKLSRRSVREFKRGPASSFVNSLYNCADPNTKIADLVAEDDGEAILYYLNKRFKLRLTQG